MINKEVFIEMPTYMALSKIIFIITIILCIKY